MVLVEGGFVDQAYFGSVLAHGHVIRITSVLISCVWIGHWPRYKGGRRLFYFGGDWDAAILATNTPHPILRLPVFLHLLLAILILWKGDILFVLSKSCRSGKRKGMTGADFGDWVLGKQGQLLKMDDIQIIDQTTFTCQLIQCFFLFQISMTYIRTVNWVYQYRSRPWTEVTIFHANGFDL